MHPCRKCKKMTEETLCRECVAKKAVLPGTKSKNYQYEKLQRYTEALGRMYDTVVHDNYLLQTQIERLQDNFNRLATHKVILSLSTPRKGRERVK